MILKDFVSNFLNSTDAIRAIVRTFAILIQVGLVAALMYFGFDASEVSSGAITLIVNGVVYAFIQALQANGFSAPNALYGVKSAPKYEQ